MYENTRNWLINLMIIPLVTGLIVAVFQFGLPKLFEKDYELSYLLEEPKILLDQNTIGDIKVEINNIETSLLVSQLVRIWNSGELPIKILPIRYVFETSSSTFKILMVNHNTEPKYEFGNITLTEIGQYLRRFVYDLLNPRDEVIIIFLTNEVAPLSVYAKGEGFGIKLVKPTEKTPSALTISVVIVAILALFMSYFQYSFFKRIEKTNEEKRDLRRKATEQMKRRLKKIRGNKRGL